MTKKNDYKFTGMGRFDKIRFKGSSKQAQEFIIEKMGIPATNIKPIYKLDEASHGYVNEFKIAGARTRRKIDECP